MRKTNAFISSQESFRWLIFLLSMKFCSDRYSPDTVTSVAASVETLLESFHVFPTEYGAKFSELRTRFFSKIVCFLSAVTK